MTHDAADKCPKMFPLQTDRHGEPGPLQIPWIVAEKAYSVYAQKFGHEQALEHLAERGGFGWSEMDILYPPWRKESDKVLKLEAALAQMKSENERRVQKLVQERDDVLRMMDSIRESARNRNPDGATLLDFFVVWNEKYEQQLAEMKAEITEMKAENERLKTSHEVWDEGLQQIIAARDQRIADLSMLLQDF